MRIWDSLRRLTGRGKESKRKALSRKTLSKPRHLRHRGLRLEQFEHRVLLSISGGIDPDQILAWSPVDVASQTVPQLSVDTLPNVPDQGVWLDFDSSDGINVGAEAKLEITNASLETVAGQLKLSGAWLAGVTVSDTEYLKLTIPGTGTSTEVGLPQVPVVRATLVAPDGADVNVQVSGEAKVVDLASVGFDGDLLPLQPPQPKGQDASQTGFVIDSQVYAQDGLAVEPGVRVVELGRYSGYRLVTVEINPLGYNPAQDKIYVFSTLGFTVSFSGGTAPEGVLSGAQEQWLGSLALNYDPQQGGQQQIQQNGNLLIVVHDDFAADVAPLVTHKQNMGWNVNVVTTSTTGPNADDIRNYIMFLYQDVATRPDAVILVGDTDRIPTFVGQAMLPGDSAPPDTDLYYATMDPGDDWYPEFPVGRISVADSAQLQDVINKIVAYETSQPAAWTNRIAFMAGTGNNAAAETTHDYVIGNYLDPLGYQSDRLYVQSAGATTADVINAFNEGRVMGVFLGDGTDTAWMDGPALTQSDVGNLTNVGMYPFVASFASDTGQFTVDEAFLETWLRGTNKGAIAAWGSSTTSFYTEDDVLERSLFQAIFGENVRELGFAANRAKELFQNNYGPTTLTRRYFEQYNFLGDPTIALLQPPETVGPVAPDLVSVIPNEGQVLSLDQYYVLSIAPRELLLRFNEGQQIDPNTLDAIRLIRSVDGQFGNQDPDTGEILDEEIEFGWVGLGDRDNEVIIRFAEPLPDDVYRLVVVGSDTYVDLQGNLVAPLANIDGTTFRADRPPEERDLIYEFELDLAPQIVAVVPQPVVRGPVDITALAMPSDGEIVAINDGTNTLVFEFDYDGTVRPNNVPVDLSTALDPQDVAVALRTAIEAEVNAGNLSGIDSVDVSGATVSITGGQVRAQYGGNSLAIQDLHQLRNVIELYFNEDDLLDSDKSAENVDFYSLFVTQNTATPNDDLVIHPISVDYDPATNKAVLTFDRDLADYGTGAFRLRVGDVYQPVQTEFRVAPRDAGTSFYTAIDVRNEIGGSLAPVFGDGSGPQSLIVEGRIDAWRFDTTLEWPGAVDEPGHRDLPNHGPIFIEDHYLTSESSPDGGAGVRTFSYYFPDVYGYDPSGAPLQNLITEAQKQRTREIFAMYGQYLGVQFYETADTGFAIVTGDLRVFGMQSGPGGVAGVAGGGMAVMDYAEDWGASEFGGGWFKVAMHEIGHLLGYGHSYDLPPFTVMGSSEDSQYYAGSTEAVFPGIYDVVHGQHMYRPDNVDIDLYRVVLDERGLFSAEILAERADNSSLLDATITLYRQYEEDGQVKYEVIARNDDYYSEDPYVELYLEPGVYFVGVTASGNTQYDPVIDESGIGGVSQGDYQLRLNFTPRGVNPNDPTTFRQTPDNPTHIIDATGTLLDGDLDGVPGGVYNFWFNVQPASNTIIVDKLSPVPSQLQDGSLMRPYDNIPAALAAAQPGSIVRIVGNNTGNDDPSDPATLRDNIPYEIGYDLFGQPLSDGTTLEVPRGVTVMIDAGAVFKLRAANIDVGSSAENVDRSGGALQVLGTPGHSVYFTSYFDETIGVDTEPLMVTTPSEGDWGGLVFRNDLDYDFIEAYDPASGLPPRDVWETQGIFLNYVNHADIRFGGGEVVVNGVKSVYTPIHMIEARPIVTFNVITNSADAVISGDPNSFADTKFQNWDRYAPFTADYEWVGPLVRGNRLSAVYATSVQPGAVPQEHINSINGMFVRVHTLPGQPTERLEVPGRFDDWDIVHVVAENLYINGTPGGPILAPVTAPSLTRLNDFTIRVPDGDGVDDAETFAIFDGSRRVVFEFNLASDWAARGPNSFVPGHVEIRYNRSDDPNPGDPADTADQMAMHVANAINWARDNLGLDVTAVSRTGGIVELHSTAPVWSLEGLSGTLDARTDARLRIDPGIIVKLAGARIETMFDAQVIAEGRPAANESAPGYPVILTSLFDTRYGTGGTFDTTEDTASRQPQPGDWGGIYVHPNAELSIDQAVVAYAGGIVPIEGDFARFNPIEIRQAHARIANTRFEFNDAGSAGDRHGRGTTSPATIFVRGAQPIIVNNVFLGNSGAVVSIDVNSLNSAVVPDWGRSTGPLSAFDQYADNYGPMVRSNRMGLVDDLNLSNGLNGMVVRPGEVLVSSVWDDTDIVHIVFGEIIVSNYHHIGGLRLQSNAEGSLVVKLSGANAGFTAAGRPLEIDDRIGGTIQIVGVPGHPVVLTDLADDTIGAGTDLRGEPQFDTNGNGDSQGQPGAWRSIRFDRYSNDRNVAIVNELEPGARVTSDLNATPMTSQPLGQLADSEKSGDDNLRLGFEVHGFIRTDDPGDVDVYQFQAAAGTEIWIDIDWTTFALDTVVELIDANGNVLARSDNSHQPYSHKNDKDPDGSLLGLGMDRDSWLRHDFYTMNPRDAGMRLVLPGPTGQVRTYYVRVRSAQAIGNVLDGSNYQEGQQFTITDSTGRTVTLEFDSDGQITGDIPVPYVGLTAAQLRQQIASAINLASSTLGLKVTARVVEAADIDTVNDGFAVAYVALDGVRVKVDPGDTGLVSLGPTSGAYQMQIRLREMQEIAGSTVQYADIRYATNGIELRGFPQHSPLLGETAESSSSNDTFATAQYIGNLLTSDRATIALAGYLDDYTDVDWYRIDLDLDGIQSIGGVTDQGELIPVVFDIDYADGMARPDLSLWVFDSAGRLIYASTGSNIADDRPDPTEGSSIDDLSRGSLGPEDPYIGPIYLREGNGATYYVAVTSTLGTPATLDRASHPLVRIEPVDAIQRVVEEHIEAGPSSQVDALNPNVSDVPSNSPTGPQRLALVPDEFNLTDVVTYVITPVDLWTIDPFTGARETDVTDTGYLPDTQVFNRPRPFRYGDVAMRNDGRLFTIAWGRDPDGGGNGQAPLFYRELDTGDARNLVSNQQIDITIIRLNQQGNGLEVHPTGGFQSVNAIAHYPTGDRWVYMVGNITPGRGINYTHNLVYRLHADGTPDDLNEGNDQKLFSTIMPLGQLVTASTIYLPDATEKVPPYDPAFGSRNSDDLFDGLLITVDDGLGNVVTFELDCGYDVYMSPLGAADVRDGDTLVVNGTVFEFNSGPVVVMPSVATDALDGATVTVTGRDAGGGTRSVTYEFDNDNTYSSSNVRVPFNNGDSAATLATALVSAINNTANFQVTAASNGGRVSLINDTGVSVGGGVLTVEGNYGVAGGRIAIDYEETWDLPHGQAQQFGAAIETTIESQLPGVNVGYAHRGVTSNFPGDLNGYGDRLTFQGATSIDVSNVSFRLVPGSGPGVSPGNVAIPFSAEEMGSDIAPRLANAITSAGLQIVPLAYGASVELNPISQLVQQNITASVQSPVWFEGSGAGGDVTGLAIMPDLTMYAVTDTGGLYRVDNYNSRGFRTVRPQQGYPYFVRNIGGGPRMVFIKQITDASGQPIRFTGLAAGPRNVEDGKYAYTLFATDAFGNVWVFDTEGNLLGTLLDGADHVRPGGGLVGIDFSPIDYNLWHKTERRWDERGHGVESSPDLSRTPSNGYDPWLEGRISYYFGLDDPQDNLWNELQPGASNFIDFSSNRFMTYNMPGGAHGSLTTGTFSLEGFSYEDHPTLYFTFYADTEADNSFDTMTVYASADGGDWQLIGSKGGAILNQVGQWVEARIDLSAFAGSDSVRLRFDFSTAGDYDIGNIRTGGQYLVAPAAAELTDGDTFTIDTTTFEFDLGYALVTPNVAGTRIQDGEYFTISDGNVVVRFEFDKIGDGIAPLQPGEDAAVAIPVANNMTARQVARAIGNAINQAALIYGLAVVPYGPNDPAFAAEYPDDNRVFLIGAAQVTQGTFNPNPAVQLAMGIEGSAPGVVTPGTVPVYVRPDMTMLEVNQVVTATVNRAFRGLPDRIYALPPASLLGESFEVTGLDALNVPTTYTFQFVFGGGHRIDPGNPTLVYVDLSSATTADDVAQQIAAAITLVHDTTGWQVTAVAGGRWVSLQGPQTFFDPAGSSLPDHNQTTIKLDDRSADTTGTVEPLMHLFGHRVVVAGPLAAGSTLAGDNNQPQNHFTWFRRGQDNNYEGWYIDDIIVGFAEHGEMVTNAPGGVTDFNFPPTGPGPGDPLVVRGPYQLEIRRAEDYGWFDGDLLYIGSSFGSPMPSADTNDRWTTGFTITALPASDIAHGDRFWIEDGVHHQEFIFLDEELRGPTGNAIPIYFNAGESAGQIAAKMADAINEAYARGLLDVTASSMGVTTFYTNERVDLWGATAVGGSIGGWMPQPLQFDVFGSVESYAGVPGATEKLSNYAGNAAIGDRNQTRDKGYIIIHSNFITHSQEYGIRVEPAARDANGQWPHPASGRIINAAYPSGAAPGNMLVPGVVIGNNVIAYSGSGGIRFSGEATPSGQPVGPIPFGRIFNNTIYGPQGANPAGVGIEIVNAAGPTLLNNVVANLDTGISVDASSRPYTVIGATVYQNNNANLVGTTSSYFETVAPPTPSLFVNPDNGNFYPRQNSPVIDSSIDSLQERQDYYNSVLQPIGIAPSPIKAPQLDVYGQLRRDDPSVAPPPGLGTNVFKDRGAVDRVDFVGPTASLIEPADNGALDRDPTLNDVVLAGSRVMEFVIALQDQGVGIDDSTVVDQAVKIYRDDETTPLVPDKDYFMIYDGREKYIHLVPAQGVWPSGHTYAIVLDKSIIRDLGNNRLQANRGQPHPVFGDAYFTVNVAGIDYGDAPDPTYPSLAASDGARHLLISNYYLGYGATSEPDSSQTVPDRFDDGIEFEFGPAIRVETDTSKPQEQIGVNVYVTVPPTWQVQPDDVVGYLNAWIDFNRDGDWDDAGEQIFVNEPLNPQLNQFDHSTGRLVFSVPYDAQLGETWARFRLTRDPWNGGYTGEADNGEVEDYLVEIVSAYRDYGDAPSTYPVTRDQNGAWHAVWPVGNPYLAFPDPNNPGQLLAAVDAEIDGQPSTDAQGDDAQNLDDENGVDIPYISWNREPEVTVYAATEGWLNAWIDYNADGDWDDPGEKIVDGVYLTPGLHKLHEELDLGLVPDTTPLGYTYARFRFSSNVQYLDPTGGNPDPTGPAPNGEVEDLRVPVIQQPEDFGDAPVTYGTMLVDNGARHVIVPGIQLGQAIDLELDGQPDSQALGDDTDIAGDDEDGLLEYGRRLPGQPLLDGRLVPGESAYFVVDVTGTGYLSLWIDYNRDGQFANYTDPNTGQLVQEWALQAVEVTDDSQPFEFRVTVPEGITAGPVIARFRYSTSQTAVSSPVGPAPDGEVEDYELNVEVGDAVIRGWKFNDENGNGVWDTQLAAQIPPIELLPIGGGTPVLLLVNDVATQVQLPFRFEYFGSVYQSIYVSENGVVSFGAPVATFDPAGFPQNVPMIAPFWADADLRLQGGAVYVQSGINALRGNPFIQIDWVDVGFFDRTNPINQSNLGRKNTFSLYMEDDPQGDIVAFVYHDMNWTTGDPVGSNGYGAPGAQIGFDAGDGTNYYSIMRPSSQAELDTLTTRQTFGFRMDPATGEPTGREPGLPGVVVYIDLNNNGVRDPDERWTTTAYDDPNTPQDETGYFEFSGLFSGTYVVREELGANFQDWIQTHPTSGQLAFIGTGGLKFIAPAPANVADGDTFSLYDGFTTIRFEFDRDGVLADPTNVRVNLIGVVDAQQTALSIATAINSVAASRNFGITATATADEVSLVGNQVMMASESMPWTVRFTAPMPADVRDGDIFAVDDGTQQVIFEFDKDGSADPAHQVVDISTATTADDVAGAIAAAIQNAATTLGLNVSVAVAADQVTLLGTPVMLEPISSPLPQGPSHINRDQSYTVELGAGETEENINFGNFKRPHVYVSGVQVLEGDTGEFPQVEVTVHMTESFGAPVQLHYRTADGSATVADNDYQPITDGTLVLQAEGTPQGSWDIRPITSNRVNDYDFRMSDGFVVWETIDPTGGETDWELFLYDLETEVQTRITNNRVDDRFAAVQAVGDRAYIVWVGEDTAPGQSDSEIFLQVYERGVGFLSPEPIQLTQNTYDDTSPQVSDKLVTWVGQVSPTNTEIFVFDLVNGLDANFNVVGSPVNVSNNIYNDLEPQVSGDTVVWSGFDGLDLEIYLYNPASGVGRLTSNRTDDVTPRISGSNVVWRGYDGNDFELYHYSLVGGVVTQLTDNDTPDNAPSVSGHNLVWQGQEGGQWEIFYYDLDAVGSYVPRNISNNGLYDEYPVVAGDQVVWHTWDGNDWEVYHYQIGSGAIARNISNNDIYDWYPQASPTAIVWRAYDGTDYEVQAAHYRPPEVTATVTLTIIGDDRVELDEQFWFEIFDAEVVGLGPGSVVVEQDGLPARGGVARTPVAILNDDGGLQGMDFGDAPASYGTLLADNGARHLLTNADLYLGAGVDRELDGQPNVDATGDDRAAVDDEDGVQWITPLAVGEMAQVLVTASAPGLLDAWVDFNGDGDWGDPADPDRLLDLNEQIFRSVPLQAGQNLLQFEVPADARLGLTFARFRFSSAGNLLYVGTAADGEVEDYQVEITTGREPGVLQEGSAVYVTGTTGADNILVRRGAAGGVHRVELNGQVFNFPVDQVKSIIVSGGLGSDKLTLIGTDAKESVEMRPASGTLTGDGFTVSYSSAEFATVIGRGGGDEAVMYGRAGAYDRFYGTPSYSIMESRGYQSRAYGFASVVGVSDVGDTDVAKLYDSAGNDQFEAWPTSASMTGDGYYVQADSFRYVIGISTAGGADKAVLHDDPATRDWFVANAATKYARLYSTSFYNSVIGFDDVAAISQGGNDGVYMYDSPTADDLFTATPQQADLEGGTYHYHVEGFRYVTVQSRGGNDRAELYDDPATYDRLYGTPHYVVYYSNSFYNRVFDFPEVVVFSSGGDDLAKLYDDAAGADTFTATPTYAILQGAAYNYTLNNFRYVQARASGAGDTAWLHDSNGDDNFFGRPGYGRLSGTNYSNEAIGFGQITARSGGLGNDLADVYSYEVPGTVDHLQADVVPNHWVLISNDDLSYYLWVIDFDRVDATSDDPVDTKDVAAAVDFLFTHGEWEN